jgi:hypothetical protein
MGQPTTVQQVVQSSDAELSPGRIMGLITSYFISSLNDGALPYLRDPVVEVFDRVVEHKGVPTRKDFRALRDRIDMLEFQLRQGKKAVGEIQGQLDDLAEDLGVKVE